MYNIHTSGGFCIISLETLSSKETNFIKSLSDCRGLIVYHNRDDIILAERMYLLSKQKTLNRS